jgi:hypothetical protein
LGRPDWTDGIPTLLTNGKTRNIYEGNITEPAIGREEDRKDALDGGNNWRDEGRTLLGALGSSLSI